MGLSKFFNKNSNLINLLVISPALLLVDFCYEKFAILALVLGFLIFIQNLFLIIYKLTSDPEKKKHWCRLLTNILNIVIIVPLCLYQYVNPSYVMYNKFIAVFLGLYSSIKLVFKSKYQNNKSEIVNNIQNYNKNTNIKKKSLKNKDDTSSSSEKSTSSCSSSTNFSSSSEISTKEATIICRKFNIKSD
jgi:hypothetical protein